MYKITVLASLFSADHAYDRFDIYENVNVKFPSAEIDIPLDKNAKISDSNHIIRKNNLEKNERLWSDELAKTKNRQMKM